VIAFARAALAASAAALVSACVAPPPNKDYTAFHAADPHSILVVPAVNRSVYVNAPDYLLSTITRPVAERGYYVFPVNLVKRVLEDDGLADADLVHNSDVTRLGELFGCDSVLYVAIERWDSQYILLSTTTTVEISYLLKDARTGEKLWSDKQKVVYQPQGNNSGGIGGLIAQVIVAAIEKADPNYMPLARRANATAVTRAHQGLPAGPYIDLYKKDGTEF
jgi:hypothetical protein